MSMGSLKNKIMRNMKGTTQAKLQSHLAETWFRSKYPKNSSSLLFKEILEMLKNFD